MPEPIFLSLENLVHLINCRSGHTLSLLHILSF